MRLGFNSNVQVEQAVYHVQTEEHGAANPYIDTVVLSQGRVLHRRRSSYEDLVMGDGGEPDESALRTRVEQQHHEILQALRERSLPLESHAESRPGAPEIRLRNAASWLVGRHATLEIEVCSPRDGQAVSGAAVEAMIEGVAGEPEKILAQTDLQGRTSLAFPLPEIAHPDSAALVIRARTADGQSQLRYRIKPALRS